MRSVSFPRCARAAGLLLAVGTTRAFAAATVLHSFAGGNLDGFAPQGEITVVNGQLFGLTTAGGANNAGIVFRLETTGANFTRLQSLAAGSGPTGSLAASGSTLYGVTNGGGAANAGTVFRLETTGSGFTELRSFSNAANDGNTPIGTPVLAGSTLYGMTQFGGAGSTGAIYRMNTDGSGFSLLHSFSGGATDGSQPLGSLLLAGDWLYGTTANGGATNSGTVFRFHLNTSSFELLHSFGGSGDGANPSAGLAFDGTTLYGTTQGGGASGGGTVFKIGLDGSGYQRLHDFAGGASDGSAPTGALTLAGSVLYGTTQGGGVSGNGTVFQLTVDGADFQLAHSFSGATDGASPQGGLTLIDGTLYGLTSTGGSGGGGTLFALAAVPEPSTLALLALASLAFIRGRRRNQR